MIVAISGYFDPLTAGHIKYIEAAKELGDVLYVILNNDTQLMKKKGYIFMPQFERGVILRNLIDVDVVLDCIDKDRSVCKTLEVLRPDIFCNGADRKKSNIPEVATCKKLGIKMIFGVGGKDKPQSSSWLVDGLVKQILESKKLSEKYNIKRRKE